MMIKNLLAFAVLGTVSVLAQAPSRRQAGDPLDHLPPNVELLTHFGERADISPDNSEVAFMDKSFGDAFVLNLKTRVIRCLTCNVPGAAFLRVMHLSNGDYILIGPEHFTDIKSSRERDNELWYLSRKPGSKPIRLGQHMSEGTAISKRSMMISFAELPPDAPEIPAGSSRMVTVRLDLSGSQPKLVDRKVVYESHTDACVLESQDFYDNDSKLTFICYNHHDLPPGVSLLSNVMSLDLATGKTTNMTQHDGTYNETEGIFPDGKYTAVEADRQVEQLGGAHGLNNIDIWKLRLDGTGKDMVRLTHFNDYEGAKASNPVVSTDGKFMCFQLASTKDPAGVGYGILIYHFSR
jgi:hypothetical protein